jgi:hypothetical protein
VLEQRGLADPLRLRFVAQNFIRTVSKNFIECNIVFNGSFLNNDGDWLAESESLQVSATLTQQPKADGQRNIIVMKSIQEIQD